MPTFDGVNLIITLDSGVTEVQIIDIYSAWKDFLLASPLNRRFPQAFISDGGNPLTSIINQGSYFFLQNQFGWRIRPPEENITILAVGNLAVADTTLPAFVPTIGAFTAAILGLQAITQGVTPVMASQLEFASFTNEVHYMEGSPHQLNGADPLSLSDPIGNMVFPLNNIPDCIIVQAARGMTKQLHVMSATTTLDTGDILDDWTLRGHNTIQTHITVNPGAQVLNCEILNSTVMGTLDGGTRLANCDLHNLNFINGEVVDCSLRDGTTTLGGLITDQAHLINCDSDKAGETTPIIDCAGNGPSLIISRYAGGIKLINKTGLSAFTIGLAGGQCVIDSTVVAGTIVVRGDGKVVDSLGNHMSTGTYNGALTLVNECTFGGHLQDIWKMNRLDPANPIETDEDGTIRVAGMTVTPVTVGVTPNRTTTQTRSG